MKLKYKEIITNQANLREYWLEIEFNNNSIHRLQVSRETYNSEDY